MLTTAQRWVYHSSCYDPLLTLQKCCSSCHNTGAVVLCTSPGCINALCVRYSSNEAAACLELPKNTSFSGFSATFQCPECHQRAGKAAPYIIYPQGCMRFSQRRIASGFFYVSLTHPNMYGFKDGSGSGSGATRLLHSLSHKMGENSRAVRFQHQIVLQRYSRVLSRS